MKDHGFSPADAWNFTLKEYVNLIKCDKEQTEIDPSRMNKETIRQIEMRHEANRKK
jgi:hypothetical protein